MEIHYPNSECGSLLKNKNWSETRIGDIMLWPMSLKVMVNSVLHNSTPQLIAWGTDFIQIYNDANKYVLGNKHPLAMGDKSSITWKSIWEDIGPLFNEALAGRSMSFRDFKIKEIINDEIKYFFFDFTITPLYIENDSVGGVLVTRLETTEKMESIFKLNNAEKKLRNIIMNAPVGMGVYCGKNYVIDLINPALACMVGRLESELIGKPLFEAVKEAKGQGLEQVLDNVYNTNTSFTAYENKFTLPNEEGVMRDIYINFIYEPFTDVDGNVQGVIIAAVEVTEQVLARKLIEEFEERNRLAIEIANIGTYDIDMRSHEIVTSDRFAQIFGIKNASWDKYVSLYHPEDRHIRDKAYELASENANTFFQVRLLLDDGTIKWVKCESKVYYDDENKPKRLIGTVLDVTETVLLQQHKDDFLAIASHELKTPLTSIKGYNEMLECLVEKGDQLLSLDIIKKNKRQIEKMTKLIYTYLDISRIESSQFYLNKEKFDFNDLISETINYYNVPPFKERLTFIPAELPYVHADRHKISHVIDNLVNNALKYSSNDKPILIKTQTDKLSVNFSVTDLGKGIDSSSHGKIFQRFFRAENAKKQVTSGFGIGLYFSAEVIKLHQGKIWFESKEAEGSTFYFKMPVC